MFYIFQCNLCKHICFGDIEIDDTVDTCPAYPEGIPSDVGMRNDKTGEPGECNGVCQFEKKDDTELLNRIKKKYGLID